MESIISRVRAGDRSLEKDLNIIDMIDYYKYNPKFMRELLVKLERILGKDKIVEYMADILLVQVLLGESARIRNKSTIEWLLNFNQKLSDILETSLVTFEEIYNETFKPEFLELRGWLGRVIENQM